MELVEGHLRLTFDLGSGALLMTSKRKYNTGVWYKITLQRNKRKGTTAAQYRVGVGMYDLLKEELCRSGHFSDVLLTLIQAMCICF